MNWSAANARSSSLKMSSPSALFRACRPQRARLWDWKNMPLRSGGRGRCSWCYFVQHQSLCFTWDSVNLGGMSPCFCGMEGGALGWGRGKLQPHSSEIMLMLGCAVVEVADVRHVYGVVSFRGFGTGCWVSLGASLVSAYVCLFFGLCFFFCFAG